MQLLLGVSGTWKCVDVQLVDGCSPCIAGRALTDLNIEPAIWYKVYTIYIQYINIFHLIWIISGERK